MDDLTTKPTVYIISTMHYDINTLDELVDALGGETKAAGEYGTTTQGVWNWTARGYLPPSRHLQTLILLKKIGKSVNPDLFDHSEDDWRLLGLAPVA